MSAPEYTPEELKEFDAVTAGLSSLNQLERIQARMDIKRLVDRFGQAKCDAMFEVLMKKDRKNGVRN